MTRPQLTVRFEPRVAVPGSPWTAVVRLECGRPTALDSIELALFAYESRCVRSGGGLFELRTQTEASQRLLGSQRIDAGTLPAGVWERSLHLELPADLAASRRLEDHVIEYVLDVRARFPGEPDRHERFEVTVTPDPASVRRPHAPLPREERRVRWERAVFDLRTGGLSELHFDAAAERATFHVGPIQVTVDEHEHPSLGRALRGELRWPGLGLGLHVLERHDSDPMHAWGHVDPELQARFVLEARDSMQFSRFFESALGHALTAFDRTTMDDATALVWQRGGVGLGDLPRFLGRTYTLAKRVFWSAEHVLPPPALGSALAAYRQFAAQTGGSLRVGDLAVSIRTRLGIPLQLEHHFEGAKPTHTVLWASLPPDADRAAWTFAVASTGAAVKLESHRVGVALPLVLDPMVALPAAEKLAAAIDPLRAPSSGTPYR